MSGPSPPPPQVARFRNGLNALAGSVSGKIGVAVSGGSDSLALLLLARAAWPNQVEAATVDHGLRPESPGEAAFVERLCADLGIPHAILPVQVTAGGDGVQGEARRARYAALQDWGEARGVSLVCTAHHADDQAETLLMRLRRGAGLAGLSGVRAIRPLGPALRLARPLLAWTRDELTQIVSECGLASVDDPSNRDDRFDRVAMRRFLAANPQFEAIRLARSAAALAEAEEALDWTTGRLFDERVTRDTGNVLILDPSELPSELVRRLLLRMLAAIVPGHASPRGHEVARLALSLAEGDAVTLAGVQCQGGPLWRFKPEAPRRPVSPRSSR